jgi:hypothetical protein
MEVGAPHSADDPVDEALASARELLEGVFCGPAEGGTISRGESAG